MHVSTCVDESCFMFMDKKERRTKSLHETIKRVSSIPGRKQKKMYVQLVAQHNRTVYDRLSKSDKRILESFRISLSSFTCVSGVRSLFSRL